MILTKLSKEDFEKILENYDIGEYKSHKHIPKALANTVYLLKTTKGKFILKIFEDLKDVTRLKNQIKIRELLQDKAPIPKIMKAKGNVSLLKYKNKNMTIEQFVQGKEDRKLNGRMVVNIAKNMALINKELLKLKHMGFTGESMFKPHGGSVKKILDFEFKKEQDKFLKEAKRLKKRRLRKSIIHSDFHIANLLFKDKRVVAIIDWSDVQKTFLVYEIAIFISHSLVKKDKIKKNAMRLFLRTYQRHIKLNEEEKKAMYFLIKRRLLGILLWCHLQAKRHKNRRKILNRWLRDCIQKYKIFGEFPLEDFLKLF